MLYAGHGYPEHELPAYRYFVGNGIDKLLERALPEAVRTPENVMKIKEDFVAYYAVHKADFTAPYAGIPELLGELKRQGILLAVASNKYHEATVALIPAYLEKDFLISCSDNGREYLLSPIRQLSMIL